MTDTIHITSVRLLHYKAFDNYSVSLRRFNVLVGPNNSGKSTILGTFRILAEGIRKARSRKPSLVTGPQGQCWGYSLELSDVSVAIENVFFDYDDSLPATVTFKLSNGNELQLFFPQQEVCSLICNTTGRPVTSPSTFISQFPISIGFVPILGPVEHQEPLYKEEAARLALLTHRAARNFRNIWYHYPEDFEKFRDLVRSTWPGMDIKEPEVETSPDKTLLHMFCLEERISREIYWAGFGFQVWCQMLTYIIRSSDTSLFIIDEPDIYLHSDLQRQLLDILKELGPDVIIATHSTEIITEADPDDLLVINKKLRSSRRLKDPNQLQDVFRSLGSTLNPILTQLAKTRRVLFVEGKDFQILSRFARKLGLSEVSNRADFAVIPVEGFNPARVQELKKGMEITLGGNVVACAIFDRDYRSSEECEEEIDSLRKFCTTAHIHDRKELENFLLVPAPMKRAIERRISERKNTGNKSTDFSENVEQLLAKITEPLRHKVQAQYLERRRQFEKRRQPKFDNSTIDEKILRKFDSEWQNQSTRYLLAPGKEVLSDLNAYLQKYYQITLSASLIIDCFQKDDFPPQIVELMKELENFRRQPSELG